MFAKMRTYTWSDRLPKVNVVFYCEEDGTVPLLEWMDTIPDKAKDKCFVRIERLEELGHELRRPEADFLRDGIYELRTKHLRVNYRIVYFFHEQAAVVLSHGLTKEDKVPNREIDAAITRKKKFQSDPEKHTYKESEE